MPGLALGLACAGLLREALPPPLPDADGWRAAYALEADPAHWNARELRLLPGIGERRALDTVSARRRHASSDGAGEPLRWEDVPGIGERTAEAVRAALLERGSPSLEITPGAPRR